MKDIIVRIKSWLSVKSRFRVILALGIGLILVTGWLILVDQAQSFFVLATPESPDRYSNSLLVDTLYEAAWPYLNFIRPMVYVGFFLGLLTLIGLLMFDPMKARRFFTNRLVYIALLIFGVLVTGWYIIGWTNLKIKPDYSVFGWYPLGAPILEWQVFVVIAFLAFIGWWSLAPGRLKIISTWLRQIGTGWRLDLVLCIVIWVVAAIHWIAIPTQSNWFAAPPRTPSNEFFPNSDAYQYDSVAQSLMVGEGFKMGLDAAPRRPVYAVMLTLFHGLVGQNYELVSRLQAGLLAGLPALMYLLGSRLHNRKAGLAAAALTIFREGNAIWLSEKITVSNSRTLMSETPTVFGVALAVLLLLLWVRSPGRKRVLALLAGGVIGATGLIRGEAAILLPMGLLLFGFYSWGKRREVVISSLLLVAGLVAFLLPWMVRNTYQGQKLLLENPVDSLIYYMYRAINAQPVTTSPGDVLGDDSDGASSLYVSKFESLYSYYMNSQVQAVLIFPDIYRSVDSMIGFAAHRDLQRLLSTCCGRANYIDRLAFWEWHVWAGEIPEAALLPILVNLAILACGLAIAGVQNGPAGYFLVVLAVAYYLVSAVAGVTGGRYVQVVDWVWVLYYGMGLSVLIGWLIPLQPRKWGGEVMLTIRDGSNRMETSWRSLAILLVGILVAGTSLPAIELLVPKRYDNARIQAWTESLAADPWLRENSPDLVAVLENPAASGVQVLAGRALYPRYHKAGKGESGISETPFTVRDFARLDFFLVGPENAGVQLPMETPPRTAMVNAEDVVVVGCRHGSDFIAMAVFRLLDAQVLLGDEFPSDVACPDIP